MSLVLFDIDGTLVRRAGPHHRQALVDAVRDVTGRDSSTEGIPVHGMLDPVILHQMMLASGLTENQARAAMPDVIEAAQNRYGHDVPDLTDRVCPGARELLAELSERDVVLALVTGNLTRIAWMKLGRAGLDRFFAYGAFGEMAATRGGLARLAIERARAEGRIAPHARISLIGDARQDVEAARENGIQSIAVRTGITPLEELESAAPDLLLEDLTGLDQSIL